MATLIFIDEPRRPQAKPPGGCALWQLGFRPFYLLASVFAALSVPLWAAQFSGLLTRPYLAGPVWHAHEMLFGFALAVIVGFLLTAGRNWTGRPTPTGPARAPSFPAPPRAAGPNPSLTPGRDNTALSAPTPGSSTHRIAAP